jgi:hypothetical protein
VTRNSDGGFSFASFASTESGLQWQGVWWTEPGSSGVEYDNTVFIPADMSDDGYTDLDYATSQNWNSPGFTVGLMYNNTDGTGLTYAGTQWEATGIPLGSTEFLPSG